MFSKLENSLSNQSAPI